MSIADEIWLLKEKLDKLASVAPKDTRKILMIASEAIAVAGSFEDAKLIASRAEAMNTYG